MNSKAVGEQTEGIILGHLIKLDRVVLIPFGNNQRYDLVIHVQGRFIRGQCKTGRFRNGCVIFSVASINGFTRKRKPYAGEVDVFWVYCHATDAIYDVSCNEAGRNEMTLCVNQPRGGAKSKIKWARDYKI